MTPDDDSLWAHHHGEWRDTAQVLAHWADADAVDPRLLRRRASDGFREALEASGATLLVTREYEHLVMALSAQDGGLRTSFLPLPHPSGLAYDAARGSVHVASTRNPNQVFELRPAAGALERSDLPAQPRPDRPLVPVSARFYPGSLYLHDLALVGGVLHGNAVALNAIVRLDGDGCEPVWWPRSIERDGAPDHTRNYLQLNSIAAGEDLESSYFSASSETPSRRRPGHLNFPVDGRGVLFWGKTREPVARGLTRPHSARLDARGRVWVDNSGYGELRVVDGGGQSETVAVLPGWTRGLALVGDIAFVATSRVIPRFRAYAPGLDPERSRCGVHAVDLASGEILGSITWPHGNQIFAVEQIPSTLSQALPFDGRRPSGGASARRLFYSFDAQPRGGP